MWVSLLQRVCYSFPTSCCRALLLSTASPPLSTHPFLLQILGVWVRQAEPCNVCLIRRKTTASHGGLHRCGLMWCVFEKKWPDYQIIMRKMIMYVGLYFDLETFKAIIHLVQVWTGPQLFRFWARLGSGSGERGSYTRGASSFPLDVADWIQREKCLFHLLHQFHPFTSPTTT